MARIRETEVEPVDIGEDSTPARGDGGFGLGVTLGVVIIVTAMLAFAYSQGAFQRADRQTGSASVAETQLEATAVEAHEALREARARSDQAENQVSDTASN